ncbi:DUF6377 domain-containing protein [uncultured Odoribacter sp.]|uniref:DUF6377 domain-containing protein n=1 Tax=uncultured Odoribacter sp. TaxID=876416 RepID=UPI002605C2AB|nr:DUF6377 domain-containing protein [uncultured Odoribacter sp.]
MKLYIWICLMVSLSLSGKAGNAEQGLKELDKVVKSPEKYIQRKEEQLAKWKLQRQQVQTDEQRMKIDALLADQYKTYIADSALYFAQEQLRLAEQLGEDIDKSRMLLAEIRIITGMYRESMDLLAEVDRSSLSEGSLGDYYHLYQNLYGAMRDYAIGEELQWEYERKMALYQDSLLMLSPKGSDDYVLVKADQWMRQGEYQRALELLLPYYATLDPDSREMGYTAYAVANVYRHMGEKKKEKDYLIVSALSDLKCGVKEYISLRELATLLYEEGDIRRAYTYMRRAMEDAAFCNARLRTIEVSQVLPIINEAYRLQREKQQRQMSVYLLCISILALFLILLAFYLRRQMKRLALAKREVGKANEQLKLLNEELQVLNTRLADSNTRLQLTNQNLAEVNYIKEAYIGRFLDLCSTYIGKLDTYRRSLNKKAMNGQTEELFRELKSTQFVEEELEEFYANFDTAFLRLFPDFVQEFNALLAEGEEVMLKPGELLNTELRIFALIRLGITDSNKIAQFLRYSLKTIYNYRTKMRNKARGVRDDFEQEVMHIGTF